MLLQNLLKQDQSINSFFTAKNTSPAVFLSPNLSIRRSLIDSTVLGEMESLSAISEAVYSLQIRLITSLSLSEIIHQAIKTVFEQEFYFNQLTNKALIDGLRLKRQAEANLPVDAKLSDKELTVLRLICEEKSTKEIEDEVELSPRTVEAIRDKLKVKTGAKSLAGLVMYAVKSGLIESRPLSSYQSTILHRNCLFSNEQGRCKYFLVP